MLTQTQIWLMRARELMRNALLLVSSILLSFIGAEAIVRTSGVVKTYTEVNFGRYVREGEPPQQPSSGKHLITTTEFSHLSHLNSLGLRNSEVGAKSHNENRVLLLGDSFTYGVGVDADQSWIAQLQRKAQESFPDQELRLINGGLPGWDVVEHLRFFRERLHELDPDWVVLVVNSSDVNDLIQRGGLERLEHATKSPRSEWLWARCHLFRWVMMSFFSWDYNRQTPTEAANARSEALAGLTRATEALAHEVEAGGGKFVILLHPYPFEIEGKISLTDYRDSFKKLDVTVIDLVDDFYQRLGSLPRASYSYPKDGHFNLEGYKVFADIAWDALGPLLARPPLAHSP